MSLLPFAALVLCFFIPVGECQFTIYVNHSQINVTVGGDAFFSVRPSGNVSSGSWAFIGKTIVQWIGQTVSAGNEYTSRAELFTSNGSLLLKSVNTSDSGEYRVNMVPASGSQTSATITLKVTERVSKPDITSNNTDPVEHNDTVSLTCSARGTDVSYLWFMNNKTVSSGGRITLSSNNSSLTISGVLRSDKEFTCSAYNMVNMNTSDPYRLNIQYGPENVTIYINPELAAYEMGSNATFSCLAVSNPAPEILWYFNGSFLQHKGHRLILVNLSLSDTGIYACEAFNNVTKRSSSAAWNFVVLEPVSNVNVTSNDTQIIEYNDTVSLNCSAKGTDVSYLWLEENTPITSGGRFELSANNAMLTIAGVLRTDRCFSCCASNLINNLTSKPLCLHVNYGPDRPNITTNTTAYIAGSTITLKCSADSRPAANLEWHFNGVLLQTGKELILDSISVNKTGNYTCQAYNNITERFSASTRKITVLEPISLVRVNINSSQPKENDTILFTCDASGTIQRRTWFKDNKLIQSDGRIITSPDNANLTITGLLRKDTGKYKCNVSNDFSSSSTEVDLQVIYGPDNIGILPQGPVKKYIGDFLTLECFAESVPIGNYTWYNGTINLVTGQTYSIPSVRKVDSGNYTCQVYNNITMKNNSLSIMVIILESPPKSSNSLSGGAIAGIVIGVIAGVVLAIGLVFCIIKTKTSRLNTGLGKSDPKGTSPENIPSSQTEYAEIERKQPSQAKPAPSSNGANAAPAQVKDGDVIYTRPNIINPGTKPTSKAVIDNKTDYAEVKYR